MSYFCPSTDGMGEEVRGGGRGNSDNRKKGEEEKKIGGTLG